LLNTLDRILRNDNHEAEQMRENLTPRLLSILLGSKADLDRNAHSETREPGSTVSVDWASAILPGKLRDFLASVVRTIYFNANASDPHRKSPPETEKSLGLLSPPRWVGGRVLIS